MPTDFSTPNKSPFRTVPLTLKLENGGVTAGGLLKLDEAARRLGCHVETLRVHIRDGRLIAVRGPHGAYYLDARDVARYPRPQRGWPKPREFSEGQLGQSWSLIEGTLPKAMAWRDRELDLVDEIRAHPERNLRLFRLLSVHRLRRLGLTFSQIAAELGITSRHARRLNAASVFLALRRELVRRDKAKVRTEALVARRAQQSSMGEGAGSRRRRRAWATRPRA
ncbi:MAG: helix-turn-helix domain-containing protein [Dehalococcoidia bacterium]